MEKTLERRGRKRRVPNAEVGLGREGRQKLKSSGAHALLSPTSMGGWDLPRISQAHGQQAAWVPAGLSLGLSDQAAWKPVLMGPGRQGPQLLAPWLSPGWTLVPKAQAAEEVLSSGLDPEALDSGAGFCFPCFGAGTVQGKGKGPGWAARGPGAPRGPLSLSLCFAFLL